MGDPSQTNVESLISNAIVLLDGDVENKGEKHANLQNALGDEKIILLDCKEIENLISQEIRKKFLNLYS